VTALRQDAAARVRRLSAGAVGAAALLAATVLLAFWTATADGTARAVALCVGAAWLVLLHVLLRRVARPRLSGREAAALAICTAGALGSFALALGMTSASMNEDLYDLSRADVGLAAVMVMASAVLLLVHGLAGHNAAGRRRRHRDGDLPRLAPRTGREDPR
jgi:hypothetical protein